VATPTEQDAALGERLAARTLELIDVASESRQEAALHQHVLELLHAGGLEVDDEGDTCLWAQPPRGVGRPLVLLAGHLDTVPAQGNRPGSRDATTVHGLGASDMKSALAVMAELALTPPDQRALDFAVLFFGREELPGDESALAPLLLRAAERFAEVELVVMMEPTVNALQAGCLGNVNARWSFSGRSGHSARPWLADNAIERAAAGVMHLAGAEPVERVCQGLVFREVASVTRIGGGIAHNVIPDHVACGLNFRFAPGRTIPEARARLAELTGGHGELEILSAAASAPVALDRPLVRALRAAGELEVEPKQAWTPVAEFAERGLPAVNFGPGDPAFAHRRDEQVGVQALVRCFRVLERFLVAG